MRLAKQNGIFLRNMFMKNMFTEHGKTISIKSKFKLSTKNKNKASINCEIVIVTRYHTKMLECKIK